MVDGPHVAAQVFRSKRADRITLAGFIVAINEAVETIERHVQRETVEISRSLKVLGNACVD